MYVILTIAVAWLILVALALAMFRSAALADRATDRQRRVPGPLAPRSSSPPSLW